MHTVAILYPGDMGHNVGRVLLEDGFSVITTLVGRSGRTQRLSTDAAIAAGPVGRDAQASTDIQLRAQILSYSRARGLFAGVTINGSTIRQDQDANQRFYGKRLTTRQVVFEGQAGAPEAVGEWRAALAKYAK